MYDMIPPLDSDSNTARCDGITAASLLTALSLSVPVLDYNSGSFRFSEAA